MNSGASTDIFEAFEQAILASAVMSLLGAVLLRLASQAAVRVSIAYWRAYRLAFAVAFMSGVFDYWLRAFAHSFIGSYFLLLLINAFSSMAVFIAVGALSYGTSIKTDDGAKVGIGGGLKIVVLQLLIALPALLVFLGMLYLGQRSGSQGAVYIGTFAVAGVSIGIYMLVWPGASRASFVPLFRSQYQVVLPAIATGLTIIVAAMRLSGEGFFTLIVFGFPALIVEFGLLYAFALFVKGKIEKQPPEVGPSAKT